MKITDKEIRDKNFDFLTKLGVDNKNHLKVLCQYHELKILRIFVFIFAIISLLTSLSPYVSIAALFYILFEIILYRYDLLLRKIYLIKRVNKVLERIN